MTTEAYMQLTLLWLHQWVLTAKPFKFTTAAQHAVCINFSKVRNSVKLDVCSSEWDDTRCVTYAWDALDHNRKFSEIKRFKMLKLVHNLQCRSNFTKRVLLLDSSRQNSPKRRCFTKIGDYWRLLSTNQNFVASPCLLGKGRAIIFMKHISLCTYTVMQKNRMFIAAILSELHAP